MTHTNLVLTLGLLVAAAGLTACKEEIIVPNPISVSRDANGYYCNMIIDEHPGPKAQVFEDGLDTPLWFTQVRDAIFYKTLPGEGTRIVEVYVQDSSSITDWENPPADGPWLKIAEAIYVIGSSKRGGMGAREAVPFGTREAAEVFQAEFGGKIVSFADIPEDYLTGDDGDLQQTSDAGYGHATH